MIKGLAKYYFTLDLRALAIFRIVLGIVCIFDVIRRIPFITLFYSNFGVWSNHYALFTHGPNYVFSPLLAFDKPWQVFLYFVFSIIAAVFLLLGFKTRLASFVNAILHIGIINRSLFLVYGGDSVLLIFLIWSVFLPLGEKYSLDSCSARRDTKVESSHTSISCFGALIQFAAIYVMAALQKNGVTWLDGSIIHYVLHQDRIVTNLGVWLRENAPWRFLQLSGYLSLLFEYTIPIGLLSPICRPEMRRIAIVSVFLLHGGIALTINIAMFPYVMMACSLMFIHPADLDWIENFLSWVLKRFSSHIKVSEYGARADRFLSGKFECLLGWPADVPDERFYNHSRAKIIFIGRLFGEVCSIFIIVVMSYHLLAANRISRKYVPIQLPKWVYQFVEYTSFREGWNMFSPEAPINDSYTVIDIELDTGEHIDIQNGKPPLLEMLAPGITEYDAHYDSYYRMLMYDQRYQLEFSRWLFKRGAQGFKFDLPSKPVAAHIWAISDSSPKPTAPKGTPPTLISKNKLVDILPP